MNVKEPAQPEWPSPIVLVRRKTVHNTSVSTTDCWMQSPSNARAQHRKWLFVPSFKMRHPYSRHYTSIALTCRSKSMAETRPNEIAIIPCTVHIFQAVSSLKNALITFRGLIEVTLPTSKWQVDLVYLSNTKIRGRTLKPYVYIKGFIPKGRALLKSNKCYF